MTGIGHNVPPADLPIPQDMRVGRGWTEQMLELADHVGPYHTLLIVDRYGGQTVWLGGPKLQGELRALIGAQSAATIADIYSRERITIPVGRVALARARRRAVIADVRAKRRTVTDAARLLRTSRPYASFLANQTGEGTDDDPPRRRPRADAGQMHLFTDDA